MHRIPQDPGILGFLTTREYLSDHIRACLALPASAYPALGQDETQATEDLPTQCPCAQTVSYTHLRAHET